MLVSKLRMQAGQDKTLKLGSKWKTTNFSHGLGIATCIAMHQWMSLFGRFHSLQDHSNSLHFDLACWCHGLYQDSNKNKLTWLNLDKFGLCEECNTFAIVRMWSGWFFPCLTLVSVHAAKKNWNCKHIRMMQICNNKPMEIFICHIWVLYSQLLSFHQLLCKALKQTSQKLLSMASFLFHGIKVFCRNHNFSFVKICIVTQETNIPEYQVIFPKLLSKIF